MVFPWFPFFVYPETSNRKNRRKVRKNIQEEIMEVQAVAVDPIFLTQKQGSSNEMAQLEILCQRKPMATSMRMRLNRLKDEREERMGRLSSAKAQDEQMPKESSEFEVIKEEFVQMAKLESKEENVKNIAAIYFFGTDDEEEAKINNGQKENGGNEDELPKESSNGFVEEENSKKLKNTGESVLEEEERMEMRDYEGRKSELSLLDVVEPMKRESEEKVDCTLLPKAPTEYLRVEFSKDSEIPEIKEQNGKQHNSMPLEGDRIGAVSMEKLFSQPQCAASTSSSSAGAQLAPRSGSAGKISNKKRGTSGSRSGASSAKQSPRPVHRSTDSIASRQIEKIAAMESTTPTAQRRRKSAFETSQAMRDLFGRTEDSPFVGLEAKTMRKDEENKKDEIKNEIEENLSKNNEDMEKMKAEGINSAENERQKHLTPGIAQLATCTQEAASANSQISSAAGGPLNGSIADGKDEKKEKIERKEAQILGRELEIGVNGKEIEGQRIEISLNQTNPFEQIQRSNSRTRSVARVAPFAYFPPQEEQKNNEEFASQTSTGIPFGTRLQIGNTHQDISEVSAITGIVQPEINQEFLKQSLADRNWSEEEERLSEKEKEKDHQNQQRNNNIGERRHNGIADNGNGPLKICAIPDQRITNNNKEASGKTISPNLNSNRWEQQPKTTKETLPGDQQRSKGSAKSFEGKEPKKSGDGEKGGEGRRNGHQKEESRNGIGKRGSQGGGGGGGIGGSGDPPSTLESIQMVNDSANGTLGSGNGTGPQLLIRNATVLNDDECFLADVLIEEGIIREISSESIKSVGPQCEQIDAEGKCLLPAGIDVHTKLLSGSSDSIGLGTKAALFGGTGTIIEVVNVGPEETGDSLLASFDRALAQIDSSAECNVGLSIPIGKWRGEQSRQDMQRLTQRGINSFVVELESDSELCEMLEYSKSIGAFCRVPAKDKQMMGLLGQRLQNQHISSSSTQIANKAQRVQQLCNLAELTNSPLVLQSIGSPFSAKAINSSMAIIGVELSAQEGPELLKSLASHQNLVCISDNSTKASIEQRIVVFWDMMVLAGKMDPMRFVGAISTNAAKMFNLYPKKGRVATGSDADLVLWDLQGTTGTSQTKWVILGGQVRYRQGHFNSIANESSKFGRNKGLFLPMALNSPYLFGLIRLREKSFNFVDFRRKHNQGQSAMLSRTGSIQSTRTSTPDEVLSGTARPGSRSVQIDQPASRATTKVIHPPGGKSTAFW